VTLARRREGRVRVEAAITGISTPIELDVAVDEAPSPGDAITIVPTRARLFPDESADRDAA